MNKVLAAELYKLRHSTVIWLMWFAGLITTVLYSVSAVTQASEYTWERWFMNYLTIFAVIGAALFSIIAGYIIAREYQNKTINNLLTYPYSRLQFISGKIIVAVSLVLATCLIAFFAHTAAGLFIVGESACLIKLLA